MKTRTVVERIGEDLGPVDWSHPIIKELDADTEQLLRAVEKEPDAFRYAPSDFTMFRVTGVRMYDGWPYWKPTPTLFYVGPLYDIERATLDNRMRGRIKRTDGMAK